jgi:protein-S-isoprenylcysteine O-methyltransferase Ste14
MTPSLVVNRQAWTFFKKRISVEEEFLAYFFGHAYTEYAANTPTWIPWIP